MLRKVKHSAPQMLFHLYSFIKARLIGKETLQDYHFVFNQIYKRN